MVNNNNNEQPIKTSTETNFDLQNSLKQSLNTNISSANRDPYRETGPTGVNLGSPEAGGLNFERYYGKVAYSKLGFNPYRDNEAYYNKNTSFATDLVDMYLQGQNLANLGFNSLWSGKSNKEEADEYAKYSNIGSTSRGGVFETVGNTFLNFGYTAGLLTEIAAEELAMSVATGLTFGGAGPAQAARTTYDMKRLIDAVNMSQKLKNTIGRIKDLKDVYKAKSFYQGVGQVAQAINPIRGTVDYLKDGARADRLAGLSDLHRSTKTFGALYRDLREIGLAYDEAQLESGFVQNTVKNELIYDYLRENGKHPDAEELQKINKEAKTAADNTLATNSLLIYTTNRVAFGNMFNKYMPKALGKLSHEVQGGRLVKNLTTKKMDFVEHGKGVFGGYRTMINEAKYAAANLKTTPLQTAKLLGKYTRANFGEGAQEYFQEVIQDAETTMAKDRYLGTVTGGAWYNALSTDAYMDAYARSGRKFLSKEGAEIFGGGFLMGMFAGPFSAGIQRAGMKLGKYGKYIYDKEGYNADRAYEEAKREDIQKKVEAFNELTDSKKDFLYNYIDFLKRQADLKKSMDAAQENGDTKSFYDAKDMALVDQILFAESMNASDLILEKIKDIGQLSDDELHEAYGTHKDYDPAKMKSYVDDIQSITERAKEIIQFSKDYDELFPPADATGYRADTDYHTNLRTIKDLNAARYFHKREAIINQYALVRTMERMKSVMENTFKDEGLFWNKTKVPPAAELTKIFDETSIKQELILLSDEIKSLEGFSPKTKEQTKDLKYKKKIFDILSDFIAKDGPLADYKLSIEEANFLAVKERQRKENLSAEVGKNINYSLGKVSWTGKIVGEKLDKKGRPQWVIEKPDGKRTSILKDSKGFVDKPGQISMDFGKQISELEKSFKNYVNAVAEYHGNSVNNAKIGKAFESFKDFYTLAEDEKNLHKTVEFLMDPEAHFAFVERLNSYLEKQRVNLQDEIVRQMEDYIDSQELSKLINMLAKEYNVVVEDDELVALREDDIIPETFYNIDTGEKVIVGSDTYNEIQGAIENWLEEIGRTKKTEEVVEEKEEEVAEEAKPEPSEKEFNIDIYNTWPEDLKQRAKNLMIAHNQKIGEEEYTDVEEYVSENNPGYQQIRNIYNKLYKKDEKGRIRYLANKIFQDDEDALNPVEKADYERLKTEVDKQLDLLYESEIQKTFDEEESTEEVVPVAEAEEVKEKPKRPSVTIDESNVLELDFTEQESVFTSDRTLVAFSPTKNEIKQILKHLRDGKKFPIDGNLTDIKPGTKITISRKTKANEIEYVVLTYKGNIPFSELGISKEEAVEAFDLQKATEEFAIPLGIGSKTYAVPSTMHAQWMDGAGNMPVFEVSQPLVSKTSTFKESNEVWKQAIIDRFNNEEDIQGVYDSVTEENTKRLVEGLPSLTAEEIEELFNEAMTQRIADMTIDKFQINDEYKVDIKVKVDGKYLNFENAVVSQITPKGVVFRSTGVKTKGMTKTIKEEDLAKVVKGRSTTDLREEVTEALSSEEETLAKETKESAEDFGKDAATINEILNEADNMTEEKADEDFFNNLGCK